jgi:integrase
VAAAFRRSEEAKPDVLAIVKAGFKAERIDDDDVSVARDNQILTDDEVGAILQAVCEVDQEQGFDGDLYRIVVCLAATGARYAQVRRMRVGDVQVSARCLMVPGSYKGRAVVGSSKGSVI